MKKIVALLIVMVIVVFLVSACEQTVKHQPEISNQKEGEVVVELIQSPYSSSYDRILLISVDGCEYLVFNSYKAGGITHKGNCKNPEHKQQK